MEGIYKVIIIGGGPLGLTASVALSKANIPHALFERKPSTTNLPKSIGLNIRTIEYMRFLDLSQGFHSLGPQGREIYTRDAWGGGKYADEYASMSPERYTMLAQVRLEPVLHKRARELNPEGVFNGSLVGVEEVGGLVEVHVQFDDGTTRTVKAEYVLAADGGRLVTDSLGIAMQGEKDILNMVSRGGSIRTGVLYHLGPYPRVSETEEWLFFCALLPNDPTTIDEITMERRIHETLQIPELPIHIKAINHWQVNAVVAERFRSPNGRIFLIGDAAHKMPPWGALGLNTEIQDVQNLVWKLAMAFESNCTGRRRDVYGQLLNSYEEERRPIAIRNAQNSVTNMRLHSLAMDKALGTQPDAPPEANQASLDSFFDLEDPNGDALRGAVFEAQKALDTEFHAPGLEVGWFYPSSDSRREEDKTYLDKQVSSTGQFDLFEYHPSAIPGHHVPHVWLNEERKPKSIRDLVMTKKFTLLADDERWLDVRTHVLSVHILPRDSAGARLFS
ncbi:FAD binding domain-containing protein [Aspergillus crustosus]